VDAAGEVRHNRYPMANGAYRFDEASVFDGDYGVKNGLSIVGAALGPAWMG
jgi:hypothetical protein